jgi:predicted negative regulator of RcsB-dependent stress response
MKRAERHHLKDNELVKAARSARHVVEERRGPVTAIAIAIVVILAAGIGYFAWTGRVSGRAHALLAEALVVEEARVGPPPAPGSPAPAGLSFETARAKHQAALTKFKIVADEYPSTDAGILARYLQAATYMALGEPGSAATTYQQVIDRAGDSLYGQMARLGMAEAQAQTGQYEQAIATFKDLAQRKDGEVPVDGVLLRLGRVYVDAGKGSDAEQTFNRLVQEFPDSPFIADARRELDQLKKT